MAARDVRHHRNRDTGIGKPDVVTQFEQAQDRPLLFTGGELLERPGQAASRPGCRSTTRPVVPVGRGVQLDATPRPVQTDEQFLDQQAVVENDVLRWRQRSGLLVDEVRVVHRGQPDVVAITKDTVQLGSRRGNAAGDDQGRATEVDDTDLATSVDPPASAQRRRQARLTSVRHPGVARCGHGCIVEHHHLQGSRSGQPKRPVM